MATYPEILRLINGLTRGQRQQLLYLISGYSAREVARRTGRSVSSVTKIRARMYERLGLDHLTPAQRQMRIGEFAQVVISEEAHRTGTASQSSRSSQTPGQDLLPIVGLDGDDGVEPNDQGEEPDDKAEPGQRAIVAVEQDDERGLEVWYPPPPPPPPDDPPPPIIDGQFEELPRRRVSPLLIAVVLGALALGLMLGYTLRGKGRQASQDNLAGAQPQVGLGTTATAAPALLVTATTTPTVTPNPTSTSSTSTPQATATVAPPTATPRPAPPPPSGTLLYRADWLNAGSDWPAAFGWKVVGSMLVNDGTNDDLGNWMAAPYEPGRAGINDYTVEADIQYVRGDCTHEFGIVFRSQYNAGDSTGFYCASDSYRISLSVGPQGGFGPNEGGHFQFKNFNPGTDWHHYLVEVKGIAIKVVIDGVVYLDTTDSRFVSGGKVGLWSYHAQLNVRSFTVTAR